MRDEFTKTVRNDPLLEWSSQRLPDQFQPFTANFHPWIQKNVNPSIDLPPVMKKTCEKN
jgi:hypothetical protein